jgi:acetolactate synthase-1/3 small subunit
VNIPDAEARAEIMLYSNIFKAHTLDVTEETLLLELTGDKEKINAFISLVENFGIKRIARTGLTAMSRGV